MTTDPVSESNGRTTRNPSRIVLGSASAVVVTSLPVFLVGALSVQLALDLAFNPTQLGLAVGAFKGAGAISSTILGRLADRLGATRSLRISLLLAIIACVGIPTLARNATHLTLFLVIAAFGKSISQPGANRMLSRNIPPHRQGIAFGIKQSATPTASLLAGASVPVIAAVSGWQSAFFATAVLGLSSLFLIGPRPAGNSRTSVQGSSDAAPARESSIIVPLLATAFGLSTVASATVPVFLVLSAVDIGLEVGDAGLLLAAASGAAIVMRLALGPVADRMMYGHLWLCTGLILIGAAGVGLLSTSSLMPFAFGSALAMVGTWGFNGVFWYSLVQLHRSSPGRITGRVAPAGMVGGVVGPSFMGLVSQTISFQFAWLSLAFVALVAGLTMGLAASLAGASSDHAA